MNLKDWTSTLGEKAKVCRPWFTVLVRHVTLKCEDQPSLQKEILEQNPVRERSMDSAVSVMKGVCVVFTVLIADGRILDISGGKTLCRGHLTYE